MQKSPGTTSTSSKKRAKSDSQDVDLNGPNKRLASASAQVVRDPVFYKPGGDCRIRVADTLFCIHRFLLERDSAAIFQTMFELPQGVDTPQGSTDEDPIVLAGDTVEEFRDLCWALYALPNDVVKENEDADSIERLANVAMISHKYQLGEFQSWSMTSIRKKCHAPGRALESGVCPPRLLSAMARLSIRYNDDALETRVIETWVSRLSDPTSSRPLPTSAFPYAFAFAEDHGLRQFLGRLYYARLTVAHRDSDTSVFPPLDFPFAGLEPKHMERLLRGSWALSAYWRQLSYTSIPELPKDPKCVRHKSRCIPGWTRLWRDSHTKYNGALTDVLRSFRHVECLLTPSKAGIVNVLDFSDSDYDDDGPVQLVCLAHGKSTIQSLITKFERDLPDYFLGPS
ncbi:hypothetical protein C8R46DRAFT_1342063 [Mycena filopes]|nr:hypothetical protein C8R46DRAFT_1342063 [Mycena filopes]